MKKIASLFLALVMTLSLAVPAFAQNGTVKVEGTIQMPTINVVLPTVASMVLNPYKMDVKLDPKSSTVSTDQVVSTLMQVKNLSDIDIAVKAKATGTIGKGTVAFANASVASDTSAPKAYIYGVFAVGNADDTLSAGTPSVVLATTEKDVDGFGPSDAVGNTNTLKASADKKTPAPNGVLNFQFFGDTSDVTTWTDKDTLGATVAFIFTPVANGGGAGPVGPTTYGVTKGTLTGNGNGGDIAIDKTTAASGDTVTVTVTPDGTNTTVTVNVTKDSDGSAVAVTGSGPYTFTMPGEAVTVTATFS